MKKLMLSFCLLVTISIGSLAQYTYEHLDVKLDLNANEIKNYTYENLRLYPILGKSSFRDTFIVIGKYIPLKDALEKKMVVISEMLGGGEVNTLSIENLSNDTIMIMAGEVITGGKQNRIIGKDLILPPHSGKVDISVFCVEAGRWENTSTGTNNFGGYYNVGSQSLRKNVEKKASQSEVWKEVDRTNALNSTSASTKTYTAITTSESFNRNLKAYTDYFKNKFASEKNIVGVIVVSGDKVIGVDMFATNDLFAKNFANLLTAYATEAIIHGKKVTASTATVKTYMDKLMKSEDEQLKTINEKGKVFTNNKGKKVRVSSYE